MRLHVVSVPHTQLTDAYSWCAFTSLTKGFVSMMHDLGNEVLVYSAGECEARCTEHIAIATGYEWSERIPPYEASHPGWAAFALHTIAEIAQRWKPGDFLCLAGGQVQQEIADFFPAMTCVEFIAGYQGIIERANAFRVFPSYAWMHCVYGHWYGAANADGRFYDAVIPHFVDERELGEGGDYLLYVGRLTERKGLKIVGEVAERTGLPLVVAGFGDESLIPAGAEFVGSVEPKQRTELMAGARCLLMPTLYVEPFGLVAVEAQMVGTPVITTDWGAFGETIEQGETGWRCSTLAEFCDATWEANRLDRGHVRRIAKSKYSPAVIGPKYQAYFEKLSTLWEKGWYS